METLRGEKVEKSCYQKNPIPEKPSVTGTGIFRPNSAQLTASSFSQRIFREKHNTFFVKFFLVKINVRYFPVLIVLSMYHTEEATSVQMFVDLTLAFNSDCLKQRLEINTTSARCLVWFTPIYKANQSEDRKNNTVE